MDKCCLNKNDYEGYRTLGNDGLDTAKKYIRYCLKECFYKGECDISTKGANIRFLEPNLGDAEKTN